MGVLDDEFGGGGIIPTDPRPRPPQKPPQGLPPDDPIIPDLLPGKPDPGLEENTVFEESLDELDENFIPITENQRFMLIGFVVLAGLYGIVKR